MRNPIFPASESTFLLPLRKLKLLSLNISDFQFIPDDQVCTILAEPKVRLQDVFEFLLARSLIKGLSNELIDPRSGSLADSRD